MSADDELVVLEVRVGDDSHYAIFSQNRELDLDVAKRGEACLEMFSAKRPFVPQFRSDVRFDRECFDLDGIPGLLDQLEHCLVVALEVHERSGMERGLVASFEKEHSSWLDGPFESRFPWVRFFDSTEESIPDPLEKVHDLFSFSTLRVGFGALFE